MADPVSMAVLFFSPRQLFFPLFLLSLPKIGGRRPPPRPLRSGTLSDNYVMYRIVSKTGWNQWKERAHVVEGPSCVVYCYGFYYYYYYYYFYFFYYFILFYFILFYFFIFLYIFFKLLLFLLASRKQTKKEIS